MRNRTFDNELSVKDSELELDVVSLWLALMRRKYLFLGSLVACSLVGVLLAFAKSASYTYTTSFQIADLDGVSVEEPSVVMAKLNAVYLPGVIGEVEADSKYDVKVVNPTGSDLIVLESYGDADAHDRIRSLHESIVARVAADHARLIDRYVGVLNRDLANTELDLEGLVAEAEYIERQIKALAKEGTLIDAQMERIRTGVRAAREGSTESAASVQQEGFPAAQLLIDHDRLQRLEDRRFVYGPAQLDKLQKARASNLRDQEVVRAKVADITAKINNVSATGGIGRTLKLRGSEGRSRTFTIFVFAVSGVIVGFFLVGFAEFLSKVSRRLLLTNQTS